MNKKIVCAVVGIVLVVGSFYGGMVYGKGQTTSNIASGQEFTYGGGAGGTRSGRGGGGFGGGAGGAVFGQIISKDTTSITVQLGTPAAGSTSQSGSKIVLISSNTKITKQTSGTLSDLAVGTNVSVTGAADAGSGSITAQSIQIRPAGTGAPQRGLMIPAQ